MSKFENPEADLSSSEAAQNLKFERADWTSFRTVEGLQQKAGVAQGRLRRLVLKELADNALDTGTPVRVGALEGGGYFIEDQGPGLDPKAGRPPLQHQSAADLDQAPAPADPGRARQRPQGGRWRGAGVGRLPHRHYPRAAAQASSLSATARPA